MPAALEGALNLRQVITEKTGEMCGSQGQGEVCSLAAGHTRSNEGSSTYTF